MRRTNLKKNLCLTGAFLFLAGCSSIYSYLPTTGRKEPPPSRAEEPVSQATASGSQSYIIQGDQVGNVPLPNFSQEHQGNMTQKLSAIDPRVQRLEKRVAELEARQTSASSPSPSPPKKKAAKKPARTVKKSPKGSPSSKKPPAVEASGAGPGI